MSNQPATKTTPLHNAVSDVVDTVQQGVPPANAQVTRVLDEAEKLLEDKKHEAPLSDKGKDIATKLQNVVTATRDTVLEKNAGEELQKMVCASSNAARDAQRSEAAADLKDTALEARDRAAYIAAKQGLKTGKDVAKMGNAFLQLGYELATSVELRRMLIDLLDMLQEGLQGAQESVESARGELASGKDAKELTKSGIDAAADASKKLVDLGDEARKKVADVASGKSKASDLVPMSEERKEQFRRRFNELLDRLSSSEAYNDATRQLFAMVDQLRDVFSAAKEKAQQSAEKAQEEIKQSPAVQEAYESAMAFFKRFVPEQQFEQLMSDMRELFGTVAQDPKLTLWWLDLKEYVRYALDHPREAVSQERAQQLTSLIDRAFDYSVDLRYSRLMRRVNRELRACLEGMKEDLKNSRLVQSMRELAAALFINPRTGAIEYKQAEMREFNKLLASLLLEELKFVPVSKLEGSTDEYDFSLSNMWIYLGDILPEHISVDWRMHADVDTKNIDAHARSVLSLRVEKMHAHIRNAGFWFRKKTGLIKLEDHGVLDVSIGGAGAAFKIDLLADSAKPNAKDSYAGFEVHRITVDMSSLSVHLVESQHKVLLTIAKPFWENSVRRSVEREMEGRIRSLLTRVFRNLGQVTHQISEKANLEKVKEVTKETLHDVQAVKKNIDKQDKTTMLS